MIGSLILVLLPMVGAQTPDSTWFADVLPIVLRVSEADARADAYPGTARGALIIDLDHLARLGRSATGRSNSKKQVAASIALDYEDLVGKQAIGCTSDSLPSCWVVNDGVIVRIDSISRADGRVLATVTTVTTERSMPGRLGTCHRTLLITLTQSGREWRLSNKEIWSTC